MYVTATDGPFAEAEHEPFVTVHTIEGNLLFFIRTLADCLEGRYIRVVTLRLPHDSKLLLTPE
jgi:hypothetical protein